MLSEMFTYQVIVVIIGLSVIPHPLVQACESKQFPANPQSLATITVVGQNPQRLLVVSTRQSIPASAVLACAGFPVSNPQVFAERFVACLRRSLKP
jgi:hypothetical protein